MASEPITPEPGDAPPPVSYEDRPLNRSEYITAMVHFYRGELQRALTWRVRLDTTTNWALVTTAGLLTFSFGNPHYAQETLITCMYANLMFLYHEARRFRFFDVWRSRLRMIEENFYGPILRRDPHSPFADWGEHVAEDLLHPKFKITRLQALRARLVRNYSYIFAFLLVAWFGRAVAFPSPRGGVAGLFAMAGLPWWVPAALIVGLYGFLLAVMVLTPRVEPPEKSFWPDPEHRGERIPDLDV